MFFIKASIKRLVKKPFWCLLLASLLVACSQGTEPSATADTAAGSPAAQPVEAPAQPNILLIVMDDVGYTDLGTWGGVIETPNLDQLAESGRALTNFHVAPTCSPTRSMLFSGTDNHIAGLGNMAEMLVENQRDRPGYEGYLNFRVAALPEVLGDAGYRTYMAGKWHLGLTEQTSPTARGFDRSFSLLTGGAGHFQNRMPVVGPKEDPYREDGVLVDELPEDFYSTDFFTDKLIGYLEEDRQHDAPFFGYLSFTAVHHPLQAPDESIAKYAGVFDEGYDRYREQRLERLKELGFYDASVPLQPAFPEETPWDQLSDEEKQHQAKVMEVYAAMMDDIDRNLGKLFDYLQSSGQFENTFIFVMSDNGPEGHNFSRFPVVQNWVDECCDNSTENLGRPDSNIWPGQNWATGSNSPLRMYKGYTTQGGIMAPAIVHYPPMIDGPDRLDQLVHVMDVMPTLLEIAQVEHPGTSFQGREVVPMQGVSFLPILTGESDNYVPEDRVLGWELVGKRALRQGDWKILYRPYHELAQPIIPGAKNDQWQLYNLADDPGETRDLADQHPERLQAMIALWEEYAENVGVVLPTSPWIGY